MKTQDSLEHHNLSANLNNKKKQNFKFIAKEYSKYLKCPICQDLMIKPMRIHPCGHTFCSQCINYIDNIITQKKQKICPIQLCSRVYKTIQQDRTAQSLIDQLKVQCTNEGCVWKGQYDMYKKTHKQGCVLKNGLSNWLSELTKGIMIRTDTINEVSQKEQQIEKNQRKQAQEEANIFEKKTEQYNDQIINQFKKKKEQSPESENNNKNSEDKSSPPNIKANQTTISNNKRKSIDSSSNIQLAHNNTGPIFIDVPFGLSIEEQITLSSSSKKKLINKQLKKLQ